MTRKYAQLTRIENPRTIRKETDYDIWYRLEHALLLALREQGTLDTMQLQQAEETLTRQRRMRAKQLMEQGGE